MKVLFYMGHPAHFHLFKNVIKNLEAKGHTVFITSKKKDLLDDLLTGARMKYYNILAEGREDDKFSILMGMFKRDFRLFMLVRKLRPDILVGTSVENSHVGPLFRIPVINVNEDDVNVVPLYAKLSYPGASVILSPVVCNNGKWESKSVKYESYHELAYLHPNHFTPDKRVVEKYFSADKPYFIIRFAKLNAHHDEGIKGIDAALAERILKFLTPRGKVYITSEREFDKQFEPYRIAIDPLDMHHAMAFAQLYIGDSQTMAAEAGVLGTPFLRFNDFVGRIGYLAELEDKYQLGYGIKTHEPEKIFSTIENLFQLDDIKKTFRQRREIMLKDKIDLAEFMTRFIEEFPLNKS